MAHASLGHDERLPLYQRLKDEMLDKIADGTWLPDQAIPTEAELTRHYGVAVGTVRKAVDMLVAEGLLQRIQGRGTFLRRPNFDARCCASSEAANRYRKGASSRAAWKPRRPRWHRPSGWPAASKPSACCGCA